MKKLFTVTFGFVVFILLSSCTSTIYFTQNMRNNLRKNYLTVNKIQFYNSKKIVMQRNLTYAETKVARGKINFNNGQYVESIIIPKKTPGVAVSEGHDYINVSFENGNNNFLRFLLNSDNEYQISAQKWTNGYGKVKYDTLIYYISPKSSKAVLKVIKNNNFNFQKKTRRLKGRTIGK